MFILQTRFRTCILPMPAQGLPPKLVHRSRRPLTLRSAMCTTAAAGLLFPQPGRPLPPEPPRVGTQSTTQGTLFGATQPETTRANSVAAAALMPLSASDRCAKQTMTSQRPPAGIPFRSRSVPQRCWHRLRSKAHATSPAVT